MSVPTLKFTLTRGEAERLHEEIGDLSRGACGPKLLRLYEKLQNAVSWRLVIVESPFAGDVERNKRYLESCLRDCIKRGESPYASHKMLTDCLNDQNPHERRMGIEAGLAWKRVEGVYTAFYEDLGWSSGMSEALKRCRDDGAPFEVRCLTVGDQFWHE